MWAEDASEWLDRLTKLGPVAYTAIAYFIGNRVKTKVSDAELAKVAKAVEIRENSFQELLEAQVKTQGNIELLTQRLADAFAEIRAMKSTMERNSGLLENLRGRMRISEDDRHSRDDNDSRR